LVKKTSKSKTNKDYFGSNGYCGSGDDCHWGLFGGFWFRLYSVECFLFVQ